MRFTSCHLNDREYHPKSFRVRDPVKERSARRFQSVATQVAERNFSGMIL